MEHEQRPTVRLSRPACPRTRRLAPDQAAITVLIPEDAVPSDHPTEPAGPDVRGGFHALSSLAVRAPLTSAAVWAAMGPLPTYGAMDGGAESVHAIVRGASAVLTACTYIWQATGITSPHI